MALTAIEMLKAHKYGVYYGLPNPNQNIPWGGYHVTVLGFAKHSLDILDILRSRPSELDMSSQPVSWLFRFSPVLADYLEESLRVKRLEEASFVRLSFGAI